MTGIRLDDEIINRMKMHPIDWSRFVKEAINHQLEMLENGQILEDASILDDTSVVVELMESPRGTGDKGLYHGPSWLHMLQKSFSVSTVLIANKFSLTIEDLSKKGIGIRLLAPEKDWESYQMMIIPQIKLLKK